MFVQVIEGKTSDPQGLLRQYQRWEEELKPGATGFLGSTGGVADDGTAITIARFESEEAARANNDRPEQGEWWSETEKFYDGEVAFSDTTDVDLVLGGGSDDAGFVQVIAGSVDDKAAVREANAKFESVVRDFRPEILGTVVAWFGDDFVEAAYFTDDAAAREGESKEPPEELADIVAVFEAAAEGARFIDLREPHLLSGS